MTTENGKNKLERQINKAAKYVGVELKEASNKYLEIKSVLPTFTQRVIVSQGKFLETKYGNKILVETGGIKDLWINDYNTIKLSTYHNPNPFLKEGFDLYVIYLNDYNLDLYVAAFETYDKFSETLLINNFKNNDLSLMVEKN